MREKVIVVVNLILACPQDHSLSTGMQYYDVIIHTASGLFRTVSPLKCRYYDLCIALTTESEPPSLVLLKTSQLNLTSGNLWLR